MHEDCDDRHRLCWVGVCFPDFGHDAVCVDKDPSKIEILEAGKVPIYELGFDALMAKKCWCWSLVILRGFGRSC